MPSNRLIGILVAGALLASLAPTRAADTSVQWGADRTSSPWSICLYDSGNICQPVFKLPSSGGGAIIPTLAINAQTGTSYTVVASDQTKLVTFSNASGVAVTLPQATGAFGAGFCWSPQNKGTGAVTITPTTSTINGASTLALTTNQGVAVCSDGTNWQVAYGGLASGGGGGSGTVTSVSASDGLFSVATPTTTPAFTVAGTPGGIPYFNSASSWASSGVLSANALMVGGGAGVAPGTATTGMNVLTALGVNIGTAGAVVVNGGALGTPSSGNGANLTGIPYTALPSLSANQILGALTATTPSGLSVPSCSGGLNALIWTSAIGFGCNTISGIGVVTTVAGLVTAFPTPTEGQPAYVTDAISCVFGADITGGATGVPGCFVHYNGSAWTAG